MLCRIRIDDAQTSGNIRNEHRARLAAGQRRGDALAMLGDLELRSQSLVDRVGQVDAGRDKNAGGHHVVLGLADEIGGNVDRVSGVVGEDRDLGGTGFSASMPTSPRHRPLGGSDIDVAGTGDEVDRDKLGSIGVGSAVGKEGDALSAADGPHLVDAGAWLLRQGWSGGAAIRRSRLGAARRTTSDPTPAV